MAVAFDTLAFSERLRAGGFSEEQAKAATEAFAHATSQELTTKTDLAKFDQVMRGEFVSVRAEIEQLDQLMQNEFASVRGEIGQLDQRMQNEFASVRGEIGQLDQRMQSEFISVRTEIEQLDQRMQSEFASVRTEIASVQLTLTIRLGIMLAASIAIVSTIVGLT